MPVCDHGRKGEAGGGMPGWKGPSTAPELACTSRCVRELAIERELESQVHGASRSHRSERFESTIAQMGMVFAAPYAIDEGSRSNFQPQANVRPLPCGLL